MKKTIIHSPFQINLVLKVTNLEKRGVGIIWFLKWKLKNTYKNSYYLFSSSRKKNRKRLEFLILREKELKNSGNSNFKWKREQKNSRISNFKRKRTEKQ
jgi:hypothetical protein